MLAFHKTFKWNVYIMFYDFCGWPWEFITHTVCNLRYNEVNWDHENIPCYIRSFSYQGKRIKKYKELRTSKITLLYKRVFVISDLYITRFHCIDYWKTKKLCVVRACMCVWVVCVCVSESLCKVAIIYKNVHFVIWWFHIDGCGELLVLIHYVKRVHFVHCVLHSNFNVCIFTPPPPNSFLCERDYIVVVHCREYCQ